jgi:hypothetical protein
MESDMTKLMSLRELFDVACKNAARIFLEDGAVSPIWHAIPKHGDEHLLIATPWNSDREKDVAMDALRDMFKHYNVQRFVCVVEAWAVMGRDPSILEKRPSVHPDRREVIRIQAEDRNGDSLSGQYYILRPEHGPATLSPFHQDPTDTLALAGRMTGLLKETKH